MVLQRLWSHSSSSTVCQIPGGANFGIGNTYGKFPTISGVHTVYHILYSMSSGPTYSIRSLANLEVHVYSRKEGVQYCVLSLHLWCFVPGLYTLSDINIYHSIKNDRYVQNLPFLKIVNNIIHVTIVFPPFFAGHVETEDRGSQASRQCE